MNPRTKPLERPLFRSPGGLLLASLLVLSLFYGHFFFDLHLKSALEAIATQANGARVNIRKLEIKLLKGEMDLYRLEMANASALRKNLLQIDHIHFRFLWDALLRKKLVLRDLSVDGVHYGTSRSIEGTLIETNTEPSRFNLLDRVASGIYSELRNRLNDNPLKNLGSLLTGSSIHTSLYDMRSKLKSIRRLSELRHILDDNFHAWGMIQAQLPTDRELGELSKAIEAGRHTRRLSSLPDPALNEVKQAVEKKLRFAEQGLTKIVQESTDFSKELSSVDTYLNDDVRALRNKLKLPDLSSTDLSNQLFGSKLLNYLESVSYWVDFTRRHMPKGDRRNQIDIHPGEMGYGIDVHYGKMSAYPDFLLFDGRVTSDSSPDPTKGILKGKLFGITTDPPIFGSPMEISGQASFPGLGVEGMNVLFKVDHTGEAYQEFLQCSIGLLPIKSWTLVESGDLNLALSRGKAQIQFSSEFRNSHLQAHLVASFWNLEFAVSSRYQRIEDTVKGAVNSSPAFELIADVSGPLEKLELNTTSQLGERLAGDIRSEFKHQVAAIDDDIRKNILDLVFPEKEELSAKFERLAGSTLKATQGVLKKLIELNREANQPLSHFKPARKAS